MSHHADFCVLIFCLPAGLNYVFQFSAAFVFGPYADLQEK